MVLHSERLKQVDEYVAIVLDKLSGISGDLVRHDKEWEKCNFIKLCEALRIWARRNLALGGATSEEKPLSRREKMFNRRHMEPKPRTCVYCDNTTHRSNDCTKVIDTNERRRLLAKQHLCFNCTSEGHPGQIALTKRHSKHVEHAITHGYAIRITRPGECEGGLAHKMKNDNITHTPLPTIAQRTSMKLPKQV